MMKKLEILKSRQTINKQDILLVESKLGVTFPNEYREFLLQHNGGRPNLKIFPIIGDSSDDYAMLEHFYCISNEDEYSLFENAISLRGRLPSNLLAIGEDPGGNYLCISLSKSNFGKIYYWDHEGELENIANGESNLYSVANNLTEFLKLLSEFPK